MSNSIAPNRLSKEKSPYLLQHSHNPVDWYPWGDEAFQTAGLEDKPIFLSIGYSTCHWCHVMAHESFEDPEIAEILNKYFIAIKVDKEERPDIDSIYMSVCQALTGSGGWPTSIFMTAEQKPFFAGTYFPKKSRSNLIGFTDLLLTINDKWQNKREILLMTADDLTEQLSKGESSIEEIDDDSLINTAVNQFKRSFDKQYGGFGNAPKFPTPHNLLFLMHYFEKTKDRESLAIVETTLRQMYKGGIFDHIGYGFSRYSTDRYFLVPHFEKMLYDNALLMLSYSRAYYLTGDKFYIDVSEKIAEYILREMTSSEGGFYCAQDADSEGIEGKFYLFEPEELIDILGNEVGLRFNEHYGITQAGNFMGKSIPNLLHKDFTEGGFEKYLSELRDYRKGRTKLSLDDKILCSWNSLVIAAFAMLYRISGGKKYLEVALNGEKFISKKLCENNVLYVSYREGRRGEKGFLEDYAFYIYALISIYDSTLDESYLNKALAFCDRALDFLDEVTGGFYIYGSDNEQLIIKPKETFDGAMPSGNSVMAYNLVKLFNITGNEKLGDLAEKQLEFMSSKAKQYPMGHGFYLLALSRYLDPPDSITAVLENDLESSAIRKKFGFDADIRILKEPNENYRLLNGKTSYYICKNHSCLPPINDI